MSKAGRECTGRRRVAMTGGERMRKEATPPTSGEGGAGAQVGVQSKSDLSLGTSEIYHSKLKFVT